MGSSYSEAQKRASIKYLNEKTDDIRLRVPKGSKDRYKEHAQQQGKSLTALIVDLLEQDIQKANNEAKPEPKDSQE